MSQPVEEASLDAHAFGQLIRRHDRQLRGVAWAVLRDSTHTDDVMQVAYEKAFRALPGFDGRSSLTTWLHQIVYRTALDHLRHEGRRQHEDVSGLGHEASAGSGTDAAGISRLELEAVLGQLGPEERAALLLTVHLGYSYDDAAEILGEARGTVASRVSRARAKVERWLQ